MKTLTYSLPSSLSFDNCDVVDKDINEQLNKDNYEAVVIDAAQTRYISSAGLRVLLGVKKRYDNLSVINTSTEVYDILEMTGFTKIINVEKSFPSISIEGCPLLGKGAHGAVYRLAPDTIVKVYYDKNVTLDDIKNERELSKKAFVLGLPTAIALQIVKVGEDYGTIFELLNATSCSKYINESQENTDDFINKAVAILKRMHKTPVKDSSLPDMKQLAFGYLNKVKTLLDNDTYLQVLKLLNNIPDTNTLIHGDFHLKNQLMVGSDLMLIDMDTLCVGHPIFEFSQICNAYYEFSFLDPESVVNFLSIPLEKARYLWKEISRRYCDDMNKEQYEVFANKARAIGCMRALHFYNKRHYPEETINACLKDLKEALSKIA